MDQTYHTGKADKLPVEMVLRCVGLHVPDPCAERDALIAATALAHGITLVTRNLADFAATGVAAA